jgi:hypothetical protein
MIYVLSGISVYLVLGVVLTHVLWASPRRRIRFRDALVGSFFMPIVFCGLMLCIAFEELWKRLMIVLDFKPPEEMRAGPETPGSSDTKEP